ncbi:MAG: manganese efflux pump MntP family protein [Candidatus Krumholzibacteriia bacterium]
MTPLQILAVAVGLAMDAAAVSLGAGASGRASGARAAFRLSFHFGLFQFLMPLLGWLLGRVVVDAIGAWDHWLAFGILAVVGLRMIRDGVAPAGERKRGDPSRGWSLVGLSIATSLDALAVGLGLGLLGTRLWVPCLVIGTVTAGLSLLALHVGRVLGDRFGPPMEIAGGLVLFVIGANVLAEHLGT